MTSGSLAWGSVSVRRTRRRSSSYRAVRRPSPPSLLSPTPLLTSPRRRPRRRRHRLFGRQSSPPDPLRSPRPSSRSSGGWRPASSSSGTSAASASSGSSLYCGAASCETEPASSLVGALPHQRLPRTSIITIIPCLMQSLHDSLNAAVEDVGDVLEQDVSCAGFLCQAYNFEEKARLLSLRPRPVPRSLTSGTETRRR